MVCFVFLNLFLLCVFVHLENMPNSAYFNFIFHTLQFQLQPSTEPSLSLSSCVRFWTSRTSTSRPSPLPIHNVSSSPRRSEVRDKACCCKMGHNVTYCSSNLVYTTYQNFGGGKIFLILCFWRVFYAHQVYIYLIKITVKPALLWNIITIRMVSILDILK